MCSRYTIVAKADEIASRFSVEVLSHYKPNYNAAPAQLLPIITSHDQQGISTFYWGLVPSLSKNKNVSERIINMRAELVGEKPVLRRALQSRRCIVPADGFYEWKRIGKKTHIPYRFVRKDRALFSFAGTWEEYEDVAGTTYHTFSIFTITPNELVSTIHDRMPVILTKDSEKIWLNKNADEDILMDALKPLPSDQMEVYTVSSKVNSQANNDATLILPAPAQDQHGNLTLFG
jgi:putative SOS response-associated peptidase YedK